VKKTAFVVKKEPFIYTQHWLKTRRYPGLDAFKQCALSDIIDYNF